MLPIYHNAYYSYICFALNIYIMNHLKIIVIFKRGRK